MLGDGGHQAKQSAKDTAVSAFDDSQPRQTPQPAPLGAGNLVKETTKSKIEPKYQIIQKLLNESEHKEQIKETRPDVLLILVNLPKCELRDIELDLTTDNLLLCSPKYELNLNLPFRVYDDKAHAIFDYENGELRVSIPVILDESEIGDNKEHFTNCECKKNCLRNSKIEFKSDSQDAKFDICRIDESRFDIESSAFDDDEDDYLEENIDLIAQKIGHQELDTEKTIIPPYSVHQNDDTISFIVKLKNADRNKFTFQENSNGFMAKLNYQDTLYCLSPIFDDSISRVNFSISKHNICIVAHKSEPKVWRRFFALCNNQLVLQKLLTINNIDELIPGSNVWYD